MKSTRAILATNAEIWKRCRKNLAHGPNTGGRDCESMSFRRLIYNCVMVKSDASSSSLTATAASALSVKDFGRFPKLPVELTSVMAFPRDEMRQSDYETYFEMTLLLNEDVLLPFLVRYKEFLKTVQVFLGKIDEWIMEGQFRIKFLEENFLATPKELSLENIEGMSFSQEKLDGPREPLPSGGLFASLSPNSLCLKCQRYFKHHKQHVRYGTQMHFPFTIYRYRCSSGEYGTFVPTQTSQLAEYQCIGTYNQTFALETELDLSLLENFAAYAAKESFILLFSSDKKIRRKKYCMQEKEEVAW